MAIRTAARQIFKSDPETTRQKVIARLPLALLRSNGATDTAEPDRRLRVDADPAAAELLNAFLARRHPLTKLAYSKALDCLAEFLGLPDSLAVVRHLLSITQGQVNLLAFKWAAAQRLAGKSGNTINLRLAAVKCLLKMGRTLGLTTASVEVDRERVEQYRDTRGPDDDVFKQLLSELEGLAAKGSGKAVRDLALTRLLYNQGMRVSEAVNLVFPDHLSLESDPPRLSLKGKARANREWVTLGEKARAALALWLTVRGSAPGPLFVSWLGGNFQGPRNAPRRPFRRILREDVFRMLQPFGIRPHGLRHKAITDALERTGGNVAAVAKFSRHKSVNVLMVYDDNRKDQGGQVARLLDAE